MSDTTLLVSSKQDKKSIFKSPLKLKQRRQEDCGFQAPSIGLVLYKAEPEQQVSS